MERKPAYLLYIMQPGSNEDALESFDSDTSFGISVGDLIDSDTYRNERGNPLLKVIRVEHKLLQPGPTGRRQITRLFTESGPVKGALEKLVDEIT